jgi:hypothetical protein
MPTLPRIFASPEVPNVPDLPRAQTSQVFGQFAHIASVISAEYDDSEARRLQAEASARMNQALKLTKQESVKPEEYESFAKGRLSEIQTQILGSASNDRIKGKMQEFFNNANIHANTEIQFTKTEKNVDIIRGNSVATLAQYERELGQTVDPEIQAQIKAKVDQHLLATVRAGAMTAQQSEVLRQNSYKNADEQRFFGLLTNDPVALKIMMASPDGRKNFPYLDNKLWEQGTNQVDAEINRKRIAVELERKTIADKESMGILNAAATPGTNILELRNAVLSGKMGQSLNADEKKEWLDRLDRQMKASDPFTHSNQQIYSDTMTGILSNPEQWTTDKILALNGKGLSNEHTEKLIALKDKALKDTPEENSKMKQAQGNLKILKDQFAFLSTEELESVTTSKKGVPQVNPTAELELKNNRLYQGLSDQLIARARAGEDPRKVAEELLQPYFAEVVKRPWYKFGFGADYNYNRRDDDTVAARQSLIQRGKEVNPAAIEEEKKRIKGLIKSAPSYGLNPQATITRPKPATANSNNPFGR